MWTNDQLSAINTTDKAVIVSAAAGSGKTAVLIERTIRLLTDSEKRIPADKLLAVTFTNDAASQMREKLSAALNKKIEENPTDQWLQEQQMKLEMAKISTINSFCLELVRNNINAFDISGSIRILDETETSLMLDNAIEEVMEKFYAEKPDMMSELNSLFCTDNDQRLVSVILDLYRFSRSLPFKDSWFDEVLRSFEKDSDMSKKWHEVIDGIINDEYRSAMDLHSQAINLSQKLQYHSKIYKILMSDIVIFNDFLTTFKNYDWDSVRQFCDSCKFTRFDKKPDKGAPGDCSIEDELVEEIVKIRDKYKKFFKTVKDMLSYSKSQINEDIILSKKVFSYLVEIVNAVWADMWEQKTLKNAVDFSDVELMSIELLCEKTENGYKKTTLAENLVNGSEYEIILIDEFQDVNNLQDIIFKMLSDSVKQEIIGKNMFVVGDVKQSIYRFRQANPKIFIQTRAEANESENSGIISEIKLKKNFRSRLGVIDFVNFLFTNIMSEEIGEVSYNIDEALDCGATFSERDVPSEIIMFNDKNDEDDDADVNEIKAAAFRIKQMLDEGYPVYDNGADRPCRPSDFCILIRSKTVNKAYVDTLLNYGLSAQCEEISGYLTSREISVLINMLSVIDNPMNDIAFVSVLLSPVFMFTADDVARIKNASSYQKLYPAFISAVGEAKNEERTVKLDDELTEKCRMVVSKLKELRFYSASLSLEHLIRKIYDSTDFFAIASVYEDGKQKRANLRLLLKYATDYDNSLGCGLSGFIRYINSVFKKKSDLKQAGIMSAETDSVIIKTIHKSKGLEFPFVFLCRTSVGFKRQKDDLSKPMLLNLDYGAGFKFYDKKNFVSYSTLALDALKYVNKSELLSEEMRLLYVALTRAKEKIFITYKKSGTTLNNLNKLAQQISAAGCVTPQIIRNASNMQEWISAALLGYEKNDCIWKLADYDAIRPVFKTSADIDFSDADEFDIGEVTEVRNSEEAFDEYDEDKVMSIKRMIDFRYNTRLSETQAKLSVSEVAKKDTSLQYFYQIPKLDENIGALTPAEKGTATHSFMELCNFEKASESVPCEIQRLVDTGLLSSKQGKAINVESLEVFFSGSFYKRMKNSTNIMREKKFLVMISDLKLDDEELMQYNNTEGMLQGIADCIFEEEDGYVLVDYKTDNVLSVNELTEHYTLQLRLYKYAFELLLDKPVKSSYIYSFKLKTGIELNF